MISGRQMTGIFSVSFRDEQLGVIVGGDYEAQDAREGNAAFTTDGGRSWELVRPERKPNGHREGVAWAPGSQGALVCVGRNGSDWSTDGGQSWHPIHGSAGFQTIAFSPTGTAYAAGAAGRIARLDSDLP